MQVERAAYDNQQAQIRQTMRFVQRFRAKSTKAKQVQSRLKQLSRMERIELAETEHRITSYNVCYTKLLRFHQEFGHN